MAQENRSTRLASKFARVIGSWKFICFQSLLLLAYVLWNTLPYTPHFDPFPFILLNLVLSFQAAFTGPIILMAQNAQGEQDRQVVYDGFELSLSQEKEIKRLIKLSQRRDDDLDTLVNYIKRMQEEDA